MIDLSLLTLAMDWFSRNNLGLLLFIIALIPLVAIAVVGYTVHVFAKLMSRRK